MTVTTGSLPHGQGHETTFAQLVSDELGIPYDDIEIEHSDTKGTPFGFGTYGSRSLAVGGTAIYKSVQKVVEKAKLLAAHLLEAAPEDIVYENGKAYVKGSPEYGQDDPGHRAPGAHRLRPADRAWSQRWRRSPTTIRRTAPSPLARTSAWSRSIATRVRSRSSSYVAVDDVGNVINPMIVDGQLHGGIAQGIAQALYEGAVYADNGELITATMNDYAMPKASMLPTYELDRTVTATTVNPMGAKGRAKRERSARPRRSPTPSSTHSRTWECNIWICRTRRSVSGAPCRRKTQTLTIAMGEGTMGRTGKQARETEGSRCSQTSLTTTDQIAYRRRPAC